MLFSKLTEEQQKDFFDHNQEKFDVCEYWYDGCIEDMQVALESIGFNDVKIGFSGFWSQGDGAHFTGSYSYKKGALKQALKDYSQWGELHTLAKELQALESKDFYAITFKISHRGHYQHENCTSFEFEDTRHNYGWTSDKFDEQPYIQACREFMQHIYQSLEKEYDYLRSWEYVKECPESWDFIDIGLAA